MIAHTMLQSLACILAAMTPCTRLYAYVGCQLRAAALAAPGVIRAEGPYASWIKEYSSDAFLALPASKEALLDKLASPQEYGELTTAVCLHASRLLNWSALYAKWQPFTCHKHDVVAVFVTWQTTWRHSFVRHWPTSRQFCFQCLHSLCRSAQAHVKPHLTLHLFLFGLHVCLAACLPVQ